MSPHYKLTYFNARGVAEPIRFIFAYAGVEYEDVRFEKTEWPGEFKDATPFGKVPVLEIDGKQIHQSEAICRYLAKKYNLIGADDWESLQIDILVDTISDMKQQSLEYFRLVLYSDGNVDEELKEQKKQVLLKETLPYYFGKFDAIIKENDGFFVNGKLTWVDLMWTSKIESLTALVGGEVFKEYPNLVALQERVMALPAIKAWVEKRPKTFM